MLEDLTPVKQDRAITSLVTISNAAELGTQVLREIMGDEISNSISGSVLTNEQICLMITNRIKENLALRAVEHYERGVA
jgi:hypothetical protein